MKPQTLTVATAPREEKLGPSMAVLQQHLTVNLPPREDKLVSSSVVRERYAIQGQTLRRWLLDDRIKFPRPLIVRRRKYFNLAELEAWEKNQDSPRTAA